MKLSPMHLVVFLLWCAMASAQNKQGLQETDHVALTLTPVEKSQKSFSQQYFNPNGIKLLSSANKDEVKLQFRNAIPDVTIEVIDIKGRLLKDYRGRNISLISFDTAQLTSGDYFIRVKSNNIQDFLKFKKN